MKNALTIRVVSRDRNSIDISWGNSGAVEIYNHTSLSVLNPVVQDWRDWVNYILLNEKKAKYIETNIRKTLIKKGKLLESVLFGGKEWKKNEINKYIFITDSEWNLLPFEILPIDDEILLGETHIVIRNIRSPFPIPENKKGTGGILWIQNHPKLKESLQNERDSLENIFNENNFSYEVILGRDNILQRLWSSLNDCEYFHFAGHSERDGIYISDEKILHSYDWIGQDLSNISLAFFNTCFSGIDSSINDGLAGTLLRIGVKELVGFSHLLPTEKAVLFATEFWSIFLKTGSSEYSVLQTRINFNKIYGPDDITHLLFIHYSGIKSDPQKKSWKIKLAFISLFVIFISGYLGYEFLKNDPIKTNENSSNLEPEKHSTQPIELKQEKKESSYNKLRIIPDNKVNKNQLKSIKIENPITLSNTKSKNYNPHKKENNISKKQEKIIKETYTFETIESKNSSSQSIEKRPVLSELQTAIENFRNTHNPLLDEIEKEKIIKEILRKEEDDTVKRWILRKKTGF